MAFCSLPGHLELFRIFFGDLLIFLAETRYTVDMVCKENSLKISSKNIELLRRYRAKTVISPLTDCSNRDATSTGKTIILRVRMARYVVSVSVFLKVLFH